MLAISWGDGLRGADALVLGSAREMRWMSRW